MFRPMVLAALGIGLAAGLVLSALQTLHVYPIIYDHEYFEIQKPEKSHLIHSDKRKNHTSNT